MCQVLWRYSERLKKNSISRAQLDGRRRPISCTTLFRNLQHASKFGGTFDHANFFFNFQCSFHTSCLSTFSIPWRKKVKNDHKLKSRGPWPASVMCGACWWVWVVLSLMLLCQLVLTLHHRGLKKQYLPFFGTRWTYRACVVKVKTRSTCDYNTTLGIRYTSIYASNSPLCVRFSVAPVCHSTRRDKAV